jgi:hypothetical protein
VSRAESVSPRACFPCSFEHRNDLVLLVQTSLCALIFLERKMLKLLFIKAFKSPIALLAVCCVVYLAAHSFFVGVFVAVAVFAWIKRSVLSKKKDEDASNDSKAVVPAAVPLQPKAVAETHAPLVTPIRRQYAKSAVAIPIKKGTDY